MSEFDGLLTMMLIVAVSVIAGIGTSTFLIVSAVETATSIILKSINKDKNE